MNSNLIYGMLGFAAGAVTATITAYTLLKKRMDKRRDEEVNAVKELYSKKIEEEREAARNKDIEELRSIVRNDAEVALKRYGVPEGQARTIVEADISERPYEIDEDELDECPDFQRVYLFYYNDGRIADMNGIEITDPERVLGIANLTSLVDRTVDRVYIRNEKFKSDYCVDYVDDEFCGGIV